jgi:hypothetical protein
MYGMMLPDSRDVLTYSPSLRVLSWEEQIAVSWDLRSFYHPVILLLVFLFLLLVPVVQLLRRTGHRPVWCLLALKPACLLVLRLQALAHGQEVHDYLKLAGTCDGSPCLGHVYCGVEEGDAGWLV